MRARVLLLVCTGCACLAASGFAQSDSSTFSDRLREAKAERAAAERRLRRFEDAAKNASNEAERLRAEQAAAGQAIEAAEARITAADAELQALTTAADNARADLTEQQRPLSSLLAGLAVMGERPPLLALTDRSGADEFVKVRILLDSSMPVIRRRTTALASRLQRVEALETQARAARTELIASRRDLAERRQRFAALEEKALAQSAQASGQALAAGDAVLSAGETVESARARAAGARGLAALAASLSGESLPARPLPSDAGKPRAPLPYALPSNARVSDGFGAVDDSGVRSRGIRLETRRGEPLLAPASGTIRFAGPFRNYDGVIIIDHGNGWTSLIVNAGGELAVGDRVDAGAPLGRALGPVEIELMQHGRRVSPAIIAGSSARCQMERDSARCVTCRTGLNR